MSGHVHVIGAGLAGLSAALALTAVGRAVTIYEAGPVAGGRCRSYFDRELGLTVDNGNHLLLSGNTAAMRYLDTIGGRAAMTGPAAPIFPFMDLTTEQRWELRPNRGRFPWWVFSRGRRVPGTKVLDYAVLARMLRTRNDKTVHAGFRQNALYRPLLAPLTVAALNTQPEAALTRLLAAVLRQTLAAGGDACLPMFPHTGLSSALIDPAVRTLAARGAQLRFSHRIGSLTTSAGRVTALCGPDRAILLGPTDAVVLAAPAWVAAELLPNLMVPAVFEAIVNVHFRIAADPGPIGFIGLIGGTAEWVFVKQSHVSTTTSAASGLAEMDANRIAASVWPNVRAALGLTGRTPPPWRVVKERRATVAATATQERRRPQAKTDIANLVLAGDWTATGLPGTIEGAIRSGETAATLLAA
ncbi:MAG TPA: hydroxysqualene dehydroxylase HpnE [Acetobacteraceae bacterium]|jgi:squalene-associated FAD-dependent desaturase|nr:hydroxysqualene dehydroxylase HpnE [Acetobacteraceae bacterium]